MQNEKDHASDDPAFEALWLRGKIRRASQRHAKFYTETLPKQLNRLDQVAQAFSKIKLNDKGLPW